MAIIKKSKMEESKSEGSKSKGPGDGIIMNKWNNYVSWLQQKGKKGSKDLDKGTEGMNMLNQYNKEMQAKDKSFTPITQQDVGKIQVMLRDYRDFAMEEIRQGRGRARLSSGQDVPYSSMTEQQKQEFETGFMPAIRRREVSGGEWADKIPGSETTSTTFGMNYIGQVESGVRQPLQLVGFASETMRGREEKKPAPQKKTNMVTKKKQ
jgi:hypothetical protein